MSESHLVVVSVDFPETPRSNFKAYYDLTPRTLEEAKAIAGDIADCLYSARQLVLRTSDDSLIVLPKELMQKAIISVYPGNKY